MTSFQIQNGAFTGTGGANIRYVPLTGGADVSPPHSDPTMQLRNEAVRSGMMTPEEADRFFKISQGHGSAEVTHELSDDEKRLSIINAHIEEILKDAKVRKVLHEEGLHKEFEGGISSVEELAEVLKSHSTDDITKEKLDQLAMWLVRHANEATTEGAAKESYKKQTIGITKSFLQLGFHNDPYNVIVSLRVSPDKARPVKVSRTWLTDDKFISRLEHKERLQIPEEVTKNAEKAENTWENFAASAGTGVAAVALTVAVGAAVIAAAPLIAGGTVAAATMGFAATALTWAGASLGIGLGASLLPSAGNALLGVGSKVVVEPAGNLINNVTGSHFKPRQTTKEQWSDLSEDWEQFKDAWSSVAPWNDDAQYFNE